MSFKEFGEIIISDETQAIGKELLENTIGALTADPVACKNLVQYVIKCPISLREQYFWNKFYRFLNGVYIPLEKTVSISNRLFDDEKIEGKMQCGLLRLSEKMKPKIVCNL